MSSVTPPFRPIHNQVLLRRVDAKDKTEGGLIIPDRAKERPAEAMVIAVGPGGYSKHGGIDPMTVRPGDKVMIGKWAGTIVPLDVDGEMVDHVVVREGEILGVLEPE